MSEREVTLNCLRDCNAACCRKGVLFDVALAGRLILGLGDLNRENVEGVDCFRLKRDCRHLRGVKCGIRPVRPGVCRRTPTGGSYCRGIRGEPVVLRK